jgi:hypothetical protein
MKRALIIVVAIGALFVAQWVVRNTLFLDANDFLVHLHAPARAWPEVETMFQELHHGAPPCLLLVAMKRESRLLSLGESRVEALISELAAIHLDTKSRSLIEPFLRYTEESERAAHLRDPSDELNLVFSRTAGFADRIILRLNAAKLSAAGQSAQRTHRMILIETYGGGPPLSHDEETALHGFWERNKTDLVAREQILELFNALTKQR